MNHRQLIALGSVATVLVYVILMAIHTGDDEAAAPPTSTTTSTAATSTTLADIERPNVDGVLRIGTVLPVTGDALFLTPPILQGVRLAVAEINSSGGVFGRDVQLVEADSGSDPEVAARAAARLVSDDLVDVIVGAATSEVTIAVADELERVRVVQCAPSSTSALLDVAARARLVRTIPSDIAMARALADLVQADGHASVAVLRVDDAYSEPIVEALDQRFEELGVTTTDVAVELGGGGDVTASIEMAARELAADPAVDRVDALVIATLPQVGGPLIAALAGAGVDAATTPVYGTDALETADLAVGSDPGVLEGIRGVGPYRGDENFITRFTTFAPNLGALDFAAQAHDCVSAIALAAVSAGTEDSEAVLGALASVTGDGAKCRAFSQCAQFVSSDRDTDYDGDSGPLAFTPTGEVGEPVFNEWRFDGQGTPVSVGTLGTEPVQPAAPTEP